MKKYILSSALLSCCMIFSACQTREMDLALAKVHADAGNYEIALPLYRCAAQAGSAEAQLALGKCYDF